MKRLIPFLILFMCGTIYANEKTPINEFSTIVETESGTYTEIGAGINYEDENGNYQQSNTNIVPSARPGIDWECYTTHNRVGFKNDISDGAYAMFSQVGRRGLVLKSKLVGFGYFNKQTKNWVIAQSTKSVTATVNGNSIRYNGAFTDADVEYVVEKEGVKQNIYISGNNFNSPYPENDTFVVVVTKLDLANYRLPKISDGAEERIFNDNADEVADGEIVFSDQRFTKSFIYDTNNNVEKIFKRLVKHEGNYYLLEGVKLSYFNSAEYPLVWDYTTISSTISDGTTWSSGTYYISTSVSCSGLTIDGGVVVKLGSGVSLTENGFFKTLNINGSSGSPVYFTSFNDDSVGESISGSSGSPAAGDWGSIKTASTAPVLGGNGYSVIRYGTICVDYDSTTTNGGLSNTEIYNCSSDGVEINNYTGQVPVLTRAHIYSNGGSGLNVASGNFGGQTITQAWIHGNTGAGVSVSGTSYPTIKNSLIYSNGGGGVTAAASSVVNIKNSTVASNTGYGYSQSGNNAQSAILDTIFEGNSSGGVNYVPGSGTACSVTYSVAYNNAIDADCTTSNNQSGDPAFSTGALSTWMLSNFSASYFLNQSTSSGIDNGSDTATALSLNTFTTSTAGTADSSTVDIGFHYLPSDVSAPSASRRIIMVT